MIIFGVWEGSKMFDFWCTTGQPEGVRGVWRSKSAIEVPCGVSVLIGFRGPKSAKPTIFLAESKEYRSRNRSKTDQKGSKCAILRGLRRGSGPLFRLRGPILPGSPSFRRPRPLNFVRHLARIMDCLRRLDSSTGLSGTSEEGVWGRCLRRAPKMRHFGF